MAFENPLLLQHSFALTSKSYSKHVSVDLKVMDKFSPVVQLYGLQRYRTIEFLPEEWDLFSPHIDWMIQYFEGGVESTLFQTIKCGNISVYYTTIRDMENVIIRRGNERELFMRAVSLKEIRRKAIWINNYLKYLQTIPITEQLTSIVETTAKILDKNLFKGSTIRDYRAMEIHIKDNYYDIYLECEKTFVYTRARLQHQMFYKYFMEIAENYFDELYKPIYKALAHYIRTPTPNFYFKTQGEDTVN